MIENIILSLILFFCCSVTYLYVINFLSQKKQRKRIDELLKDSGITDEGMKFLSEEQSYTKHPVFIRLPIELRNYKKPNIIQINKCEECHKKAESMGLDIKKVCPELNCDELEDKNNYEVIQSWDFIKPEDIKGFLEVNGYTQVTFYDGSIIPYSLSVDEFVEKISDYVNINL